MCNIYVFHENIFDSIKNVEELSSRQYSWFYWKMASRRDLGRKTSNFLKQYVDRVYVREFWPQIY